MRKRSGDPFPWRARKDVQLRPCAALGRHVSKSRRGRTLSGQIRTRGAADRIRTRIRRGVTHTRVRRRARERDGRRTHTTPLTNPREPSRAVPGNFCCATERPSRNLAYARLANQPGTDVSSTRSTLHRRRAAPHQQRARHTPARTNECTFACLARSRALVQPNEPPCRQRPSRVEPNRVRNSEVVVELGRARFATRNLP